MKKLTIIASLLFAFQINAQNTTNPSEYLSYFSTEYNELNAKMWAYTSQVANGKSARKVEATRKELIAASDKSLAKTRTAKDFNGDGEYRKSLNNFYQVLNAVLKEDYSKIVDMEAIAEQSYDLMEAYITAREQAGEKVSDAGKELDQELRNFCKKNNVNLIEDQSDISKKMEIASQVYDTYNQVYLIFFKAMKQEAYLMNAMSNQDLSSIEQNREALIAASEEGLEKLKAVQPYGKDSSMIVATKDLLNMYIQEANAVDETINLILATENFNKIKTSMDQKKPKDRTKEDVDQYNNAVNEMNAKVTSSNENNERFNKERAKKIDNWNSVAEKFTKKHVPK
ncbi:MAG: hypothetical protein N4A41_03800 [Crocinitomicaceae bacterium]|jgi:hypothetical protein|nr:hypothetical protein [Crocinitomicaceae bacterium]